MAVICSLKRGRENYKWLISLHGNDIGDTRNSNATVLRIHGKGISDARNNNRKIATVDDTRRAIDGAGALDEMTVVALWCN